MFALLFSLLSGAVIGVTDDADHSKHLVMTDLSYDYQELYITQTAGIL